jgi:hypothetical protein
VSAKTQENIMERELFRLFKALLRRLGRRRRNRRFRYTDAAIVEVYYWAVLHDRPVLWACRSSNWPPGVRRGALPSQPEMSRRLRTASVLKLINRLEQAVLRDNKQAPLIFAIDAKPLPIAGHSADPHAGYGRAAGGKAKGYKLHVLLDLNATVWSWRVTPMNGDERTMAHRLLRSVPDQGYLLADANYNSNKVFASAALQGVQLIAPRRKRRKGPMGLGHHRQHPARLRSIDILENSVSEFGRDLLLKRRCIERFFGTLSASGGGLTCLPGWVRHHPRVRLWVQAKLVFNQLRADRRRSVAA